MPLRADLRRRGIGLHVIEQGLGARTVESRGRLRHAVRARRQRLGPGRLLRLVLPADDRAPTGAPGPRPLSAALRTAVGPGARPAGEHHAIDGVIERIDQALGARVIGEDGDGVATMAPRSAIDLLADALVPQPADEERELIEPMARFGAGR
jgi:hypothetical protein